MGLNARCITTSLVQRLAWWSYNMREIKKYCTHQIPSDHPQSVFGRNSTSSIRVKLSGSVSQSSFCKKGRSILTTIKAGEVIFGWNWPNQGNQSPCVNFFSWQQLSRDTIRYFCTFGHWVQIHIMAGGGWADQLWPFLLEGESGRPIWDPLAPDRDMWPVTGRVWPATTGSGWQWPTKQMGPKAELWRLWKVWIMGASWVSKKGGIFAYSCERMIDWQVMRCKIMMDVLAKFVNNRTISMMMVMMTIFMVGFKEGDWCWCRLWWW